MRFLRYIFLVADYEPFELFVALVSLLSAVVILNPYTDIYTNSQAYEYLSLVMSENFLGGVTLFFGLNSLFALFCGNLRYRRFATVCQSLLWGVLFVLFLTGNAGVWFPWFLGIYCLFSVATASRIHKDIMLGMPSWTEKR